MMEKALVLLSGGLDSTTVLHHVRHELNVPVVYACSFHYGQKHAIELEMARWQAQAAGVTEHLEIDLTSFGLAIRAGSALTNPDVAVPALDELSDVQRQQPPTYVPHRNMVLLSLAAACAEARGAAHVFYGAHKQDAYGYWDCSIDFIGRLNDLLSLNRGQAVTVHAPFVGRSKREILKIGLALGVDYRHTWTCYRGENRPCGACPSCCDRQAAFDGVGVLDPLIQSA